jgi:cell division protease FtsH
MTFGQKEELVFLGKEIGEQRDYSEAVAQEIDGEVRRIVQESYHRAKDVLEENREILERIANYLIEVETLSADGFVAVFEGREPEASEGPPPPVSGSEVPAKLPDTEVRKPALDMPPAPAPA